MGETVTAPVKKSQQVGFVVAAIFRPSLKGRVISFGSALGENMASAAEQLAANFNFSNLGKATELRDRILFTLGALIIARLGTYIPMPGINPHDNARSDHQQQGGLLDMFNMLSGGAVQRMAIFALGIMPYISASIIIQLMTTVIPDSKRGKRKAKPAARSSISTRATALSPWPPCKRSVSPSHSNMAASVCSIRAVLPLIDGHHADLRHDPVDVDGRADHRRGVGNGISLIIFVGIVARFPVRSSQLFEAGRTGRSAP